MTEVYWKMLSPNSAQNLMSVDLPKNYVRRTNKPNRLIQHKDK